MRTNGVIPLLLVDGLDSQSELLFLKYIVDKSIKWNINISKPYGTGYWQVGDSAQQKRNYKMFLGEAKNVLARQKFEQGLNMQINKNKIIQIVKYAWEHFFALTSSNKNVISKRVWGPLNHNLLCHSESVNTMIEKR